MRSLDRTSRLARDVGPGVLASLLLHLLVAALVLLLVARSATHPEALAPFVPVEIVRLSETTTSPVHQITAAPRPRAARASREVPTSRREPVALSPRAKRTPPDTLEIRLKALAQLRQPETRIPLPDNGASDATDAGDGAASGTDSAYSLRDFIQAQVERRWSLDLGRLGGRDFVIPIRVVVAGNGDVQRAEIVDRERSATDAAYREVALSARNAVLLSSPIALPAGRRGRPIDVVLRLDPRGVLK